MIIRGLKSGTAIAAILAIVTAPTFAQDDQGGLRIQLGVQQGFGYGDNLALGVPGSVTNPEEGSSALSTSSFALQLESITRTQEFRLQTGGSLRYGHLPEGSTQSTGFVDPFVSLYYKREGAASRFTFDARLSETSISQAAPLWEFSDEDGLIAPPADLGQLTGTGTRQGYAVRTELETGIDSPIGFRLGLRAEGADYEDATSTSLTPYDRYTVTGSTYFRFNEITSAVLDLRYSHYSNDSGDPDRETKTAEVGFDRDLASGGTLSARIGYTQTDQGDLALGSEADGVTGRLGYSQPLLNGSLGATYGRTRDSDGEIDNVMLSRRLELPLGRVDVRLGATSLYGASPELVGGLGYNGSTRTGGYSVRLDRTVTSDSNDENRFTTLFSAQYSQDLTAYSSFVASLSYYQLDETSLENGVEQTNLRLGYQYELTQDWSLNSGISLRSRDEDNVGKADSQEVYLNIARKFDLN